MITERVRHIVEIARQTATRQKHSQIEPEHLLIGLVAEGEGVAAAILQILGVDLVALRNALDHTERGVDAARADSFEIRHSPRADRVLERARAEAKELEHSYIGTEHLLLALVRDDDGKAARLLGEAGIDYHNVRRETLRLLGTN